MAKNTRQQFVQARLKAIGGEATPEQRVKLRQRFDVLSATKEGRTKIAKVVLPDADAKTRAVLKKSLVPQTRTNTGSTTGGTTGSTTGGTTGSTGKSFGVMGGTGGSTNKSTGGSTGSTTTSTIAPTPVVTPTTLPNNTTSTTMAKNNTSTSTTTTIPSPTTTVFTNNASSAVVPSAQKTKTNNLPPGIFENLPINGTSTVKKVTKPKDVVYGDQAAEKVALKLEKYNVPILGRVAGIGRNLDAGKNKEAGIGLLNAVGVTAIARFLPAAIGAAKTAKTVFNAAKSSKNQNTNLQNEFRLSEALRYERTAENARTVRQDFGDLAEQRAGNLPPGNKDFKFPSIAEQRAGNPPPGNKDFKFPSIKDQQKAYEYKPVKTRAGEPGTSGKNFSLDEYGRPVKLPKIK